MMPTSHTDTISDACPAVTRQSFCNTPSTLPTIFTSKASSIHPRPSTSVMRV